MYLECILIKRWKSDNPSAANPLRPHPPPQVHSLEGNDHLLRYADVVLLAAFLPKVFCVQRTLGVKTGAIKSQVLPQELYPGFEVLQATQDIPRQRQKPHGVGLHVKLFNRVQKKCFLSFGVNFYCWGRHRFASACFPCSGKAWALKACQFVMKIWYQRCGWKGCFHLNRTIKFYAISWYSKICCQNTLGAIHLSCLLNGSFMF